MAIFGNPATEKTEELFGEVTIGKPVTPYVLNYWYAILLLLFQLFSTFLNPFVYIYYTKQRPSDATLLFRILTVMNFLTDLYKPMISVVRLVSPGQQVEYRTPKLWEIVDTVFSSSLHFASVFVTIMLAASRVLKIKNPFMQLNPRYFLIALMVYFPVVTTLVNYSVFLRDTVFVTKSQKVQSLRLLLNKSISVHTILNLTVYLVLGGVSLYLISATIYLLNHSRRRMKSSKKGGIFLILLMNFANFIFIVLSVAGILFKFHFGHGHMPWFYENLAMILNVFLPVALAGFNPLLVAWFNKNIRKMLRVLVCEGRFEVETAGVLDDSGRNYNQMRPRASIDDTRL